MRHLAGHPFLHFCLFVVHDYSCAEPHIPSTSVSSVGSATSLALVTSAAVSSATSGPPSSPSSFHHATSPDHLPVTRDGYLPGASESAIPGGRSVVTAAVSNGNSTQLPPDEVLSSLFSTMDGFTSIDPSSQFPPANGGSSSSGPVFGAILGVLLVVLFVVVLVASVTIIVAVLIAWRLKTRGKEASSGMCRYSSLKSTYYIVICVRYT